MKKNDCFNNINKSKSSKKVFTFSNSGPNSIEGFKGLLLAVFGTKRPSTVVYRSDCKTNEWDQQYIKIDIKTNCSVTA